jgi:DHA2 family multidrug resistance protein
VRSLGSAVGISITQAVFTNRAAVSHADMTANIQPGNPTLSMLPPGSGPGAANGLISLNGEITRQAAMVGYVDVFRMLLVVTIVVMPLLFIMRPPRAAPHSVEMVID